MTSERHASYYRDFDNLYVGGRFIESTTSEIVEVDDSFTEATFATIPRGSPDDVPLAVQAAREAFDGWSSLGVETRVRYLVAICEQIQERTEELAEVISREVGMPIGLSKKIQVGLAIADIENSIKAIQQENLCEVVGNSKVFKEPIGVVAAITPWNYPLHQIMAKIGPALASGCTVVVKPASEAPLSAAILAEIVHSCRLPGGVFNLIFGPGADVGRALVGDPCVDMVSFTGSTRAGRDIGTVASQGVKRVVLELGGKSANVFLPDGDIDRFVPAALNGAFLNSGQTCSALTRLVVPKDRADEIELRLRQEVRKFSLGSPFEKGVRVGPLVSSQQQGRVRSYIDSALEEGARLVCGGTGQPPDFPKGYFIEPTILADVTPKMRVAQEEVFGPVLSVLTYESEEEALEIANDTIYGLAGAVWSEDAHRATKFALRMRAGQVDINGATYNSLAPFGGYKQSGNGRELGKYGLAEYFELKALQT